MKTVTSSCSGFLGETTQVVLVLVAARQGWLYCYWAVAAVMQVTVGH